MSTCAYAVKVCTIIDESEMAEIARPNLALHQPYDHYSGSGRSSDLMAFYVAIAEKTSYHNGSTYQTVVPYFHLTAKPYQYGSA